MFSGGVGSWYTAKRLAETVDPADITLLFSDTLMEDEDLYRFLEEAATDVQGATLIRETEGRDPWQVFFDARFLGNHRIDPCSRILKRELLRKWIDNNCDPANTVIYIGIDWTEAHRFERAKGYWHPWEVKAPLCDPPYADKRVQFDALKIAGIELPRLYKMGFPHNNCGGFCIKAGQAHFKLLLETMPERYAYHEAKEQELREFLDADVAIMADRTNLAKGEKRRPLTMKAFRERVESTGQCDMFEWGGCGCFSP